LQKRTFLYTNCSILILILLSGFLWSDSDKSDERQYKPRSDFSISCPGENDDMPVYLNISRSLFLNLDKSGLPLRYSQEKGQHKQISDIDSHIKVINDKSIINPSYHNNVSNIFNIEYLLSTNIFGKELLKTLYHSFLIINSGYLLIFSPPPNS
jgi:hypothetical protein